MPDEKKDVGATARFVWIAERGCYSDMCVTGVYDTAEAAKADNKHRGENWKLEQPDSDEPTWSNGLGWSELVVVYRVPIQTAETLKLPVAN